MIETAQTQLVDKFERASSLEFRHANQPAPPWVDRPKVPYLKYLEGLRGLAALDVTLYHIWGHTLNSMPVSGHLAILRDWTGALLRGRVAVNVFIVLSGYLLMRPAARSPDGLLPGGIWVYLQRRAWRILLSGQRPVPAADSTS